MSKINKKDIELISSQTSGKHLAHVFLRFLIFRNMMTLKIGNEEIKLCNKVFFKVYKEKWTIGYVGENRVVYRIKKFSGESFAILLAQDIIGKLCKIKHIDGNTMNYRPKNITGININKSFAYDVTPRPVIVNPAKTINSINHLSFMNIVFESKMSNFEV